ncbi:MAG: hypothetical protein GY852_00030, partial [bacterium]|nr:hypothetical protein [bacterium]
MKRGISVIIFLGFLSWGCAHRAPDPPLPLSAPVAVVPPEDSEADTPKDQQKSDVNEVYAEPIHELVPKAQRAEEAEEATNYDGSLMGEGELETGFLDDDIDFLDEEE